MAQVIVSGAPHRLSFDHSVFKVWSLTPIGEASLHVRRAIYVLVMNPSCLFRRALELEPELRYASDALEETQNLLSNSACVCTLVGHSGQVHDISTFEVS